MQIDLGECLQLSVLTLNIKTFVTSVGLVAFITCETVFGGCGPTRKFSPEQNILLDLITVQQDATYSVYHISVGSSTCFGR